MLVLAVPAATAGEAAPELLCMVAPVMVEKLDTLGGLLFYHMQKKAPGTRGMGERDSCVGDSTSVSLVAKTKMDYIIDFTTHFNVYLMRKTLVRLLLRVLCFRIPSNLGVLKKRLSGFFPARTAAFLAFSPDGMQWFNEGWNAIWSPKGRAML